MEASVLLRRITEVKTEFGTIVKEVEAIKEAEKVSCSVFFLHQAYLNVAYVDISRVYTSTVLTRVKYNPAQYNPGYICVAATHNIPHACARHCDDGTPSRNRFFNLSML